MNNYIQNFLSIKKNKNIYVRKEYLNYEIRTPITPQDVSILINHGFNIYVESSTNRIYSDTEYVKSGATITNEPWYNFPNYLIIGLKQLNHLDKLNYSSHMYFSHSYLNQSDSELILKSFGNSHSLLFDLEFFLDSNLIRLVTFGFWAGSIGTILALKQYYNKVNQLENINNLKYFNNFNQLLNFVSDIKLNPDIKIGIIGPNGNCGKGAQQILNLLGLKYIVLNKNFDSNMLLDLDIIINCIKLSPDYNKIWFESNTKFYKPVVISDISCDYSKPNNPIKIYNNGTTWINPIYSYNNLVDVISIDNLPSLLPKESSDDFSKNLTKLLLDLENDINKFWENNMLIYIEKITKYI